VSSSTRIPKKLGRIPDGGGHRVHGRSTEMRRQPRLGYDHFEVIVDDRTRRSVVVEVADESGTSAAAALAQALSRNSIQRSGSSSSTARCRAKGGPARRSVGPASSSSVSNRDSTKIRTPSMAANST